MRVCHFLSGLDPSNGGTATALAGLAPAQVRAGLDVTVGATWVDKPGEEAAARMREAGVKVRLLGPCKDPMSRHPDLPRFAAEMVGGADVVHVHALWEEIQHRAAVASRRARVPYLFTPHGMLSRYGISQGLWKKKLYMALRMRPNLNRAAALHFTSEQERDLTSPLGLKAPALIEPNGIDLREFERLPAPGTFRSRHPRLAGKRVIMFLGRVSPEKGLDLLLPAFARADVPDAVLVLVGPDYGGCTEALQRTAAGLGLADRTIFTGPLYGADRVAALADADLFVLPSYQENFGIAAVEALAAGKAVVVSDQVGIHADLAAARVAGVVPHDVDRLAAELRRWLGDNGLREGAGARARAFVWERYDWDVIGRRWVDHYARIRAAGRG